MILKKKKKKRKKKRVVNFVTQVQSGLVRLNRENKHQNLTILDDFTTIPYFSFHNTYLHSNQIYNLPRLFVSNSSSNHAIVITTPQ